MEHNFVSGVLGGVVAIVLFLCLCLWGRIFDYKAVVIVDQAVLLDTDSSHISVPEYELMNSLREQGVLLTPSEYTNNIVGYYDTLISFLAIFFVVFTFAGYFYVKGMSRKEVREEAREILKDSESFRKDVLNAIHIEFDGNYVAKENYENEFTDISDKVGQLLDDVERLKNSERKSSEGKVVSKKKNVNKP